MKLLLIAACVLAPGVFVLSFAKVDDKTDKQPQTFKAVSFNIRYGTADDGQDRWPLRRHRVIDTIRDLDADIVGLQETLAFQTTEILEALPRYAAVGTYRIDGRSKGEGGITLYDRMRFVVAESGVFWLSDTPQKIGSITWDNVCTRVCNWVRLVDQSTGRGVYVYNLHLDHKGQDSRERSTVLVRKHMADRAHDDPFVVLGDMNAAEDNKAIHTLINGRSGASHVGKLVDTYREEHPTTPAGTFTGFNPASDGGKNKIDYVLAGKGLDTLDADIDRRKIDGRYPSDHFPVWARLKWNK